MADKRCDNGHFIDEAWDICPYCPQDESEPEIPVVRPRSIEQVAPSAAAAAPAASGAVNCGDNVCGSGQKCCISVPGLPACIDADEDCYCVPEGNTEVDSGTDDAGH